jgi:hypothetical protein
MSTSTGIGGGPFEGGRHGIGYELVDATCPAAGVRLHPHGREGKRERFFFGRLALTCMRRFELLPKPLKNKGWRPLTRDRKY